MPHFIDIGPDCWSRRTIISEARKPRNSDISMDEMLKNAIIANFKDARKRDHKGINKTDSSRYIKRRISAEREKLNLGNRWESVAAKDDFTNDVVDVIFHLIPQLKGSGAFTGYVRYALTNRWTNRFHFNKRILAKLKIAVENDDESLQERVLNDLIADGKISDQAKSEFSSRSKEKKLNTITAWENQKAITNMYYNKANATAFLEADEPGQLAILKKWGTVTLPTTDPSTFVVRYCNNMQFVQEMIDDTHQSNIKVSDDSIDKQLSSGKLARQAEADGITDDDRAILKDILAQLHDNHRDIRDYSSEEIDTQNNKWKDLFDGEDINKEEDWSNVDWDAEDEDEEIRNPYGVLKFNFNNKSMDTIRGVNAIDSALSQLAYNKSKWSSNRHGKVIYVCNDPYGEDEIDEEFYIAPKKAPIDNRGDYRIYALKTVMLPTGPSKIIDKDKDFDISAHDVDHIDISYGNITIMLKHPVSTNY